MCFDGCGKGENASWASRGQGSVFATGPASYHHTAPTPPTEFAGKTGASLHLYTSDDPFTSFTAHSNPDGTYSGTFSLQTGAHKKGGRLNNDVHRIEVCCARATDRIPLQAALRLDADGIHSITRHQPYIPHFRIPHSHLPRRSQQPTPPTSRPTSLCDLTLPDPGPSNP